MRIRSWIRVAIVVGLTGTAACLAGEAELPQDGQHRVETISLSAELESLGGIGGVSVDAQGRVIMANFHKYVWRISPDGEVEVLSDQFAGSSGNMVLGNGDILQSDFETQSIMKIGSGDGDVEVFADEGLDGPVGLATDPEGNVYVANFSGGYIARISPTGGVAAVFARHDRMTNPNSIVRAPSGDFYVADLRSPVLFKISAEGQVTEFVTLPGQANGHVSIADGALYVTQLMDHRVLRVELDGSFRAAAGTGVRGFEDDADGPVTVSYPNGIAVDPSGRFLYFNNHRGVMSSGERGDILLRVLHIDR